MHNLDHLYVSFQFSDSSAFFLCHHMLTWFGWRSDHFTTILSIRCWTFLPYTRVRVALPLSLYICAVAVFAVSSLTYKKKNSYLKPFSVCMAESAKSFIACALFSSFLYYNLIFHRDVSWLFTLFFPSSSTCCLLVYFILIASMSTWTSRGSRREKRWKEVEKRVNTFL